MADPISQAEEQEKIRIRARARASGVEDYEPIGLSDLTKRFNKGVWDLISLPSDMVNAGIRFSTEITRPFYARGFDLGENPLQLPTDQAREDLARAGIIPDPEDPAEAILEHTAEILGAGAVPHAAITKVGSDLLKQSILQIERLGIFKSMAVNAASRPFMAAGAEGIASLGAGTARGITQEEGASLPVQISAELLGGITPFAMVAGARQLSTLRLVTNIVQKHLFPFTKGGGWQRASARMRGKAADPEKAAGRIDIHSDMPPARQTGDENLLALEKAILAENPDLASETNKVLNGVREALKTEVLDVFGGDPTRPRRLLIEAKQYLIEMLDLRAAQAADDVRIRLDALDPNADARDISRQVRAAVDDAYGDARATESELWKSIDSDAPVGLGNAKERLRAELATRSRFADPEDIPAWVTRALGGAEIDPKLMKQLQAAGAVDSNGNFVSGMRERLIDEGVIPAATTNFNDARVIRTRLLQEIRVEQAKDAPNRNKIRILGEIANGNPDTGAKGLLDDIGESGVLGAKEARDYSRHLNERFTRGQVGRLLGFDRTGAEKVSEAATLDYLLAGRDPATNIEQLIKAAPESGALIQNFIKSEFVGQTSGGANRRAVATFIAKWERRGAFEQFPELQGQLTRYASSAEAAAALQLRADQVRSFANKSGKSTAALYLDSDPGSEMQHVLSSNRPAANARKLRAKMRGDVEAEGGLRTSFLEEGFKSSESGKFYADGSPVYSGDRFTAYLSKNKEVARALGTSTSEWDKLESIALRMRQLDARPGAAISKSIDDTPAAIIDLAVRYIGAQQGGRLGNSMGSSLVMAGAFTKRARAVLDRLNRGTAKQLLIDATRDPQLYRALLTNPYMPEIQQVKAAKTIQSWLVAVGATQEVEDE